MWKKEDKFLLQFSSRGPQRKQCRIFSLGEMKGSIIFPDFQKNIPLGSRKWLFTIFLDNFASSLWSSDKEAVCARSVCFIIENGAFIIADKVTTLESLIIIVTLLNVSHLILLERLKQYGFHVFL